MEDVPTVVTDKSSENLKTETVDDGQAGERINVLINLVSELDSETLLHVVSPKILDHFSIWDIILEKAKLNSAVGAGAMESILNDTSAVLGELKLLIESALRPVRMGKASIEMARKKKQVFKDFVMIDHMLSLALCIDSAANLVWKKRDPEDVVYANPLLDTDTLFPPRVDSFFEEDADGDDDDGFVPGRSTSSGGRVKTELDEDTKQRIVGADEDDEMLDDGAMETFDEDPDFRPSRKGRRRRPGRNVVLVEDADGRPAGRGVSRGKSKSASALLKSSSSRREGQFECGKCKKRYVSGKALYLHMEKKCEGAVKEINAEFEEKADGGGFLCKFESCVRGDDAFASKEELEVHWADEHVADEEKFVPCRLCDKRFATVAAIKSHLKTAHVKPYKCTVPQCDRSFAQKENLQFHMANHAEIITGDNVDGAEGEDIAEGGQSPLKRRRIKTESTERYLCLKCGQTVAMSHGKKHEARCTGMHVRHPEYKKVNEEYFCTVEGCNIGYGFNSVYGLRKHFHGMHVREEEKYFACDYCEERFSFLTTKNKHMKMKHIKPHICDICGKGFGFKNKLSDHRLIHTGEKPYACDKCEYRASKKGNLDAHKIDKHGDFGGNKNYICAMCNKQFTTMGRVRRHMEIMHAEGKEESARLRRQRQRLAQNAQAQVLALQQQQQQQQQQEVRFKQAKQEEEEDPAARPSVVHMVPAAAVVQQQPGGQATTGQQQQVVQQVVAVPDEQEAAVQFLETHLDRDLYH